MAENSIHWCLYTITQIVHKYSIFLCQIQSYCYNDHIQNQDWIQCNFVILVTPSYRPHLSWYRCSSKTNMNDNSDKTLSAAQKCFIWSLLWGQRNVAFLKRVNQELLKGINCDNESYKRECGLNQEGVWINWEGVWIKGGWRMYQTRKECRQMRKECGSNVEEVYITWGRSLE